MRRPIRPLGLPGSSSSTTAPNVRETRPSLGAAAVSTIVLLAAAPGAVAADDLPYALAGTEVYRNARDGNEIRYDQWRLAKDGSLSGNFRVEREVGTYLYTYSGRVTGRWEFSGNTLCIDGDGLEVPNYGYAGYGRQRICYQISKSGFAENEFAATNAATGFIWQMFVYSQR